MSAFLVSTNHIHALVSAAARVARRHGEFAFPRLPDHRRPNLAEVGAELIRENVKSIQFRYPNDKTTTMPDPDTYAYVRPSVAHDVVVLLKAIDCYEYQSCEHDGWRESWALTFCSELRLFLIGELPGYDAAPWGL